MTAREEALSRRLMSTTGTASRMPPPPDHRARSARGSDKRVGWKAFLTGDAGVGRAAGCALLVAVSLVTGGCERRRPASDGVPVAPTSAHAANGVLELAAGEHGVRVPPPDTDTLPFEFVVTPGPLAGPLVLGPPVRVVEGFPGAREVVVAADGRYYVMHGTHTSVVDPRDWTVSASASAAPAGAVGPSVDRDGRRYHADAAAGAVLVTDPPRYAPPVPYLVLTHLDGPGTPAVDTRRAWLLVPQRSGQLGVYELPSDPDPTTPPVASAPTVREAARPGPAPSA